MQINTKLSQEQVEAEAQKFGLTPGQIAKFTFQVLPSNTAVTVYPGHADSAAMSRFLEHLIATGKAR